MDPYSGLCGPSINPPLTIERVTLDGCCPVLLRVSDSVIHSELNCQYGTLNALSTQINEVNYLLPRLAIWCQITQCSCKNNIVVHPVQHPCVFCEFSMPNCIIHAENIIWICLSFADIAFITWLSSVFESWLIKTFLIAVRSSPHGSLTITVILPSRTCSWINIFIGPWTAFLESNKDD